MLEHNRSCEARTRQGPELGNRLAGAGHSQVLSSGDPVDNFTTMVAKIADADFGVSHVGHCITRDTPLEGARDQETFHNSVLRIAVEARRRLESGFPIAFNIGRGSIRF